MGILVKYLRGHEDATKGKAVHDAIFRPVQFVRLSGSGAFDLRKKSIQGSERLFKEVPPLPPLLRSDGRRIARKGNPLWFIVDLIMSLGRAIENYT